jgi:hypothetical protein
MKSAGLPKERTEQKYSKKRKNSKGAEWKKAQKQEEAISMLLFF